MGDYNLPGFTLAGAVDGRVGFPRCVALRAHPRGCQETAECASVPARTWRRRLKTPRAVVTEEVVAREDIVDLQAVGAGVPLADVALEERFMTHDRGTLAVAKKGLRRHPSARLAGCVVHICS